MNHALDSNNHLLCGGAFFLLVSSRVNVPRFPQTLRKGMVNVVNERFKVGYRRRDAGDISTHR